MLKKGTKGTPTLTEVGGAVLVRFPGTVMPKWRTPIYMSRHMWSVYFHRYFMCKYLYEVKKASHVDNKVTPNIAKADTRNSTLGSFSGV